MDPRLQPRPSPGPQPLQDVRPVPAAPAPAPGPVSPPPSQTPRATAPQPPTPVMPVQNPILAPEAASYEVVASIPMAAQPGQIQATPSAQLSENAAAHREPEDELDKILQAVNNRVQAPATAPPKTGAKILSKVAAKAAKAKQSRSAARPVGAMAAVIAVFLVLSAAAVMAYRQNSKGSLLSNQPGKVGTSSDAAAAIQSAGGTLVRPADLDDYSQTLSTQLNSLNDKGDFDSNSLSDAVLGL